jgi:thiol-disulfide isomerase/thioredoxin
MKIAYLLLTILPYILSEDDDKHNLLDLTDTIYKQYINSQQHFFILYHNPWCKWSQKHESRLNKIHEWLKLQGQNYYIGKLDVSLYDSHKIISEHIPSNILNSTISYPKLVYYKDGTPIDVYSGRPNKTALYIYMKRKINTASEHISNIYSFKDRLAHDSTSFVLFTTDDNILNEFNKLAKDKTDYLFYDISDPELMMKINNSNQTTISIYKGNTEYSKKNINTKDDIIDFFKKETFNNLYTTFNDNTLNEIFMKRKPAVILFRNIYDNKTKFLEESIPVLASQEKDLLWIITDLTGKYEIKLAKLLAINNDNLPALRIVDFKNKELRRYELSRELKIDNVLSFIRLYKKNELTPYYSTQSSQKIVNSKVKRITAASFYENVVFNRKHVLVYFHTSWCGHCKRIIPVMELLQDKYNSELFSVMMIDLEENGVNGVDVKSVPAAYLYSIKDKDSPIRFEEKEFSLRTLTTFVEKHTYLNIKSDL